MVGSIPTLYSFPDTDAIAISLRDYILESERLAIERHGTFRVAVSGGSLPAVLVEGLLAGGDGAPENTPHFSSWDIFFADERVVPLDHEDSNYRLLKEELIDKIPEELGKPIVHPINAEILDNLDEIADQYQEELMKSFAAKDSVRLPVFDLILLGCGPDGHTCSLFPGHDLLRETDSWVAPISDSPKPPPRRITLTLPVITHGLRIAFVAMGGAKQDIMKQIFDSEEGRNLPCALVNSGAGEKVTWFADRKATATVAFPKRAFL